jgi:hypothetical protein
MRSDALHNHEHQHVANTHAGRRKSRDFRPGEPRSTQVFVFTLNGHVTQCGFQAR